MSAHTGGGTSLTLSRNDATTAAIAAAVFVAATITADRGVTSWERVSFGWINQLSGSLFPVIWVPMQLGSLGGALAMAAVFGVLGQHSSPVGRPGVGRRKRALWIAGAAGIAILLSWILAKVVKTLVGRGRPYDEGIETVLHEPIDGGLGYVSGHAALVFALLAMVAPYLERRVRLAALALAVTVCVARIYTGTHLPLDVVGGGSLGLVVGTAVRWIALRAGRIAQPAAAS